MNFQATMMRCSSGAASSSPLEQTRAPAASPPHAEKKRPASRHSPANPHYVDANVGQKRERKRPNGHPDEKRSADLTSLLQQREFRIEQWPVHAEQQCTESVHPVVERCHGQWVRDERRKHCDRQIAAQEECRDRCGRALRERYDDSKEDTDGRSGRYGAS